ncbi:MAG: 6-phospho-beta-glucosidase [Clostridiaceae bacterium]|nr:6-phospho-beta-glucosidase [Clostridiaceae bacterium]
MKGLKIAVIGAGSTYTPELIDGFIQRKNELPVDRFYMMDIDEERLEIVGDMAGRMLKANSMDCKVIKTESLEAALHKADFVIVQIRVGKLDARVKDEKIPLKYGMIGQETTGIGGFMKGMRTIPELMKIAGMIEKYCPDAWMINFSNPSGMLAEAVLNHTQTKMIGLCNVPVYMIRSLKPLTDGFGDVTIDYVGLNHLSWITGVYCDGVNILPEKLMEVDNSGKLKNIPNSEFDAGLLKTINAYPCGYLTYFYYRDRQLKYLLKEEKTRGEICREIENELLLLYQNPGLAEKPPMLDKRGGAMYSEAAVSLISAIYNDKNEIHVVNTKNNGALDFMDKNDVVEISCRVNKNGVFPISPKGPVNEHIKGMMRMIKTYEKHAVKAGLYGDYNEAVKAVLIHPLANDYNQIKGALDELMEAHRYYLPQFYR